VSDAKGSGSNAGGIGLATVLIALIFLFVWPGPFRWAYSGGNPRTKIDRISGTTFVLTGEGWHKVATNVRQELPPSQWSDIKAGKDDAAIPGLWGDESFSLWVRNRSGYAVTEVEVEAWRDGKPHERLRLIPESTIEPGTSAGVKAAAVPSSLVLHSESEARDFHWEIVGAKGYPFD